LASMVPVFFVSVIAVDFCRARWVLGDRASTDLTHVLGLV
jgi:hypothetical protein